MNVKNNEDFFGFKQAENLDGSPINYLTTETATLKTKHMRTKKTAATTWLTIFIVGILVVAFYSTIFRWNHSSNSAYTVIEYEAPPEILTESTEKAKETYIPKNNKEPAESYIADNIEEAAESYMAENYGNYDFISIKQNGDSYHFHYQIIEDTEFLAILTPITLSCNTYANQSNFNFTINTSDSVREWHLAGEWFYTDDTSNYYLKINRCEGDTLYAEYSFSEISSLSNNSDKIPYTDSSNGEISLTICSDNDEHYFTTDIINLDIYPYGTTLDIGGDGAGINLKGIWLNKRNE